MSRQIQFSIRLMLGATALVAIAAWALTCGPSVSAIIALVAVVILFASIGTIAFCGTVGRVKSFWLGVTIPIAVACIRTAADAQELAWFWVQQSPSDFAGELPNIYDAARFSLIGYLSVAPINGLLCVFIHWLIWPRPSECGP